MSRIYTCLGVLAALIFGARAFAAGPMEVRASLADGAFETAYTQAETLGTADGYALAAEILLSEIMIGEVEKNKKQAKRARKLAKAGLELEPANQNARLQYAIADGFVTREASDVSAWMKKLPQKTQAIVQDYRTDFPSDPRGDALLGAWHLAIARKAKDKNAQKWFGASIVQGRELFQKARLAEPDDIIISVNFAFGLLALDSEDQTTAHIEEARQILTKVTETEPTDFLSRVLKGYAEDALPHMDDRDIISDYAGMFMDGERPVFE